MYFKIMSLQYPFSILFILINRDANKSQVLFKFFKSCGFKISNKHFSENNSRQDNKRMSALWDKAYCQLKFSDFSNRPKAVIKNFSSIYIFIVGLMYLLIQL